MKMSIDNGQMIRHKIEWHNIPTHNPNNPNQHIDIGIMRAEAFTRQKPTEAEWFAELMNGR